MSNEGTQALLDLGAQLLAELRGLREDMRASRGGGSGGGGSNRAATGTGGGGGAVFPGYGRSKGQPVVGATMGDLEYYASGARRSLGDPGKARFHDKERALLASIEAEIARQSGGSAPINDPPPDFGPGDDDIPF